MREVRTPEQITADDELSRAILAVCAAYRSLNTKHTMLTDFIVIGRALGYRDGDELRTYFKLFPKGGTEIDWDAALGMTRRAQVEIESEYLAEGEGQEQ